MPHRHKKTRQPKQKVPKQVKLARPKIKELRTLLKGLMTVSIQNRQASLSYILAWYDNAIPYLLQKKWLVLGNTAAPSPQGKKLGTAVKCRKQAQGTTLDHEKESALLMAVRAYEKVCDRLRPPSVDKYYTKFKAREAGLTAKKDRMEQKFGGVVKLLQQAIGDRIKLEVADAQKMLQFNSSLTTLSYNREAAKELAIKFRSEGLLAIFVEQLPFLSRHAALERVVDVNGQESWEYDPDRDVEITHELLKGFVEFAKTATAPKKLVRNSMRVVRVPQTTVSSTQGTQIPRVPRASAKGPRVAGFIVPGTAIALVYERLQDEQEHELTEVTAGLTTADPVGRVKQLGRYGAQKGLWTVAISNGKARLTRFQTQAAQTAPSPVASAQVVVGAQP